MKSIAVILVMVCMRTIISKTLSFTYLNTDWSGLVTKIQQLTFLHM
jgi:hypothetical protein